MKNKNKLNFLIADKGLANSLDSVKASEINEKFISENTCNVGSGWCSTTWAFMRMHGADASISTELRPDSINFIETGHFRLRTWRPNAFIVNLRGDKHETLLANFIVDQNPLRIKEFQENRAWIYYWPQAGLIPRNEVRGNSVTNLSFKGAAINLDEGFRSDDFIKSLKQIGVNFDFKKYNNKKEYYKNSWLNYEESDLVIAVRNMTYADALGKPASKLVNAWRAGVPAILGPEPEFRRLRSDHLDYIEVTDPDQAVQAIRELKLNTDLYKKMRERCNERAKDFQFQNIVNMWFEILDGPILREFEKWKRQSSFLKAIKFPYIYINERKLREEHYVKATVGRRIFEQ